MDIKELEAKAKSERDKAKERRDKAEEHRGHAKKAREKGDHVMARRHDSMAREHEQAAEEHEAKAEEHEAEAEKGRKAEKAAATPARIAFARLTKIDEEKRLVYGRATQEVPDRAGEMFDYAGSKPYFERWSSSQLEASFGKSAGNVRGMHSKVAAGILTPQDGIIFNDAEKAIDVVAHVVDDAEWEKVQKGVYTGFSIGGRYVSKSPKDPKTGVVKYIADPSEVSLVDRPSVPGATFFDVQKADGTTERREFELVQMRKLVDESGSDLGLELKKAELPKPGTEFTASGRTFVLKSVDDKLARVEELYRIEGSEADLAAFGKALAARGLSLGAATAILMAATPRPKRALSDAEVLAKAAQMAHDEEKVDLLKLAETDDKRKAYVALARAELQKIAAKEDESHDREKAARVASDEANIATEKAEDASGHRKAAAAHEKASEAHAELGRHEQAAHHKLMAEYHADMAEGKKPDAEKMVRALAKIAAREDVDTADKKRAEHKYGEVEYADEKNKKYPLDTEKHVRAAWAYINMPKNERFYSSADLAKVKGKIKAAAKKFGIEISEEEAKKAQEAFLAKVAGRLAKAAGIADLEKADTEKREEIRAKAEALFERHQVRKGLYQVSNLSQILQALCDLMDATEMERMREGDDSDVPERLGDAIEELGEILVDMAEEEVKEELGGEEDDEDEVEAMAKMGKALVAKAQHHLAELQKIGRRHSAADMGRVQRMHDASVELGAKCAGGDVTKGAVAVLRKADGSTQSIDVGALLVKFEQTNGELQKALGRIDVLERQPAPAAKTIVVRAVGKSEDGQPSVAMQRAAQLASQVEPVMKSDGSVDEVATAVKMTQVLGGQRVTLSKS